MNYTRNRHAIIALASLAALILGAGVGYLIATQPPPTRPRTPVTYATATTLGLTPEPAPTTSGAQPEPLTPPAPASTAPASSGARCELLYQPGMPTPTPGTTCTHPDGTTHEATTITCADGSLHLIYQDPTSGQVLAGQPGGWLTRLPDTQAATELVAHCQEGTRP